MGGAAADRLAASPGEGPRGTIDALNRFLFEDEGFAGNTGDYDDPRNSFLNQVLDRRTGIPITLAVVYIEVARRAGIRVDGVNFPGHFLLRYPLSPEEDHRSAVFVDPFHGGSILSETDCRSLLRRHAGDGVEFDPRFLAPATKQQILVRMLGNLKRLYVRMRSFPQGRAITDLLLAIEPSALQELRDRGLLSYYVNDYAGALRDSRGVPAVLVTRRRRRRRAPGRAQGDLGTREGVAPANGEPQLGVERRGLLAGRLGARRSRQPTMGGLDRSRAGGSGISMGRSSRSPHSFHDPM